MKEVCWEVLQDQFGGDVPAGKDVCLIVRADMFVDNQMMRWDTMGTDYDGDSRTIAWYTSKKPKGVEQGCYIVWKNPRFRYFMSGQTGARIEDADMLNISVHKECPKFQRLDGTTGERQTVAAGDIEVPEHVKRIQKMQETGNDNVFLNVGDISGIKKGNTTVDVNGMQGAGSLNAMYADAITKANKQREGKIYLCNVCDVPTEKCCELCTSVFYCCR